MKTFAKLLKLGLFSLVLAVAPVVTSVYAAPDEPKPSDDGKKKKKGGTELRPDGLPSPITQRNANAGALNLC